MSVLLCILSNFSIILKRKKELVALILLSSRGLVTKRRLFLTVPWVGRGWHFLIILIYVLDERFSDFNFSDNCLSFVVLTFSDIRLLYFCLFLIIPCMWCVQGFNLLVCSFMVPYLHSE